MRLNNTDIRLFEGPPPTVNQSWENKYPYSERYLDTLIFAACKSVSEYIFLVPSI